MSVEVNIAVLKAFWILVERELNKLGPRKRSENFLKFVLQKDERKELLVLVLYLCTSHRGNVKVVIANYSTLLHMLWK